MDLDPEVELDEDDDLLARPRRKPARKASSSSVPPASASTSRFGPRWLLVAALVVGVGFGAWYAGRLTAGAAPAAEAATSAATATEVDTATRIAELNAALEADPSDAAAHLELGVILFGEGDIESAYAHWSLVTTLAPGEPAVWYNLGFYYLSTDPPDEAAALEAWQQVIEIAPDSELAQTVISHIGALEAAAAQAADGE
jgi:cytochrome c-type biogenesis protein CcmH/NrfG